MAVSTVDNGVKLFIPPVSYLRVCNKSLLTFFKSGNFLFTSFHYQYVVYLMLLSRLLGAMVCC